MKHFSRFLSVIMALMIFVSAFAGFEALAYDDVVSVSDIDMSKFTLPVISVTTENNAPIVDKENYVSCSVTIDNTDEQYCLDSTVGGIRFRGNSTLTYADKKAYRIKFEKKQNLFDMGKAKSWVLLANAFDKTMVRNAIAFEIAKELGLEYTTEYRFVNLYLNGQCQGLYLLCEQTQTGKTRVNVEEDETGKVDTGYLVEFVGNGDTKDDAYFKVEDVDPSLFAPGVTENWRKNVMKFIIKTPEKKFCTQEQIDFISAYSNSFNKAILTQDWQKFDELCDIDSFVKFFIVNTVMNNGDGGFQIYFYKKENGGKVYAGPVWDFDQSSGSSTHCTGGYTEWYYGSSNPWFDSFSSWDKFMDAARKCYGQHIEKIKNIIDYYTNTFYGEHLYDFHVNDVIWNSVENTYWRITQEIAVLRTYEANFLHLNTWFSNRIRWLDSAYHKLGDYVFNNDSTCHSDGTESATCSVCGYVSTHTALNTADPTKHVLSEYVYNNDATKEADGTKTAVCSVCGYEDTVTVPGTKLPLVEIVDTSLLFTDVKSEAWYKTYVDYAYSHGLLRGMTDTEFEPGTSLTRAMFVTVLARIDGVDTSSNKFFTKFDDVEIGRYYTAAVKWGIENGIVNGMTEKLFEPNGEITREQMCVMLVRYADFKLLTLKTDREIISFDDDGEIHNYARNAIYICQRAGIVNGSKDGDKTLFRPRGTATRAEAAKILSVFYSDYIFKE